MLKKLLIINSFFIFSITFLLGCDYKTEDQQIKKKNPKVLIVHSYHKEMEWVVDLEYGIKSVFDNKKYDVKYFYMDTKRKTDENYKIQVGKKALKLVEDFKPEVIITTDDNAQQYFAKHLIGNDSQIVFCGVNANPKKYNFPAENVTGLIEALNFKRGFRILKKVFPEAKSFSLLTDNSPTSNEFIKNFKNFEPDLLIDDIIQTDDFDEWKEKVKNFKSDILIVYVSATVKDKGEPMNSSSDVTQWTVQNTDKPVFSFAGYTVSQGALFGYGSSPYEHGQNAAKYAVQIINGKKASELPVKTPTKGTIVVNDKTAKLSNFDISSIKNIADEIIK